MIQSTWLLKSAVKSLIIPAFVITLASSTNSISNYSNNQFDDTIQSILGHINTDSIESYIQHLQNYGSRHLLRPERREAAQWLKEKYISFGFQDVVIDSFECHTHLYPIDTTTWQYNVIARKIGIEDSNELMVMGAHYDSYNSSQAPASPAPGADDNGSGTAATLEVARVMMELQIQTAKTIEFVNFAAEELMYFGDYGSQHYVNDILDSQRNVTLMINNDMIAYDTSNISIINITNLEGCEMVTSTVKNICQNYTTLTPDVNPLSSETCCDHLPFYEAGFPCVMLIEESFNPNYHTEDDILEYLNMDYCAEVTKISIGTLVAYDMGFAAIKIDEKDNNLKLFPNPTRSYLNIEFEYETGEFPIAIDLISVNGSVKYTLPNIQSKSNTIDCSKFTPGIYFVKIKTKNRIWIEKVIIQQ